VDITRRQLLTLLPAAAVAVGSGELCSSQSTNNTELRSNILYSGQGWTIYGNPEEHSFALHQADLGAVVSSLKLNVLHDGTLQNTNNWHISPAPDGIRVISNDSTATTWEIKLTKTDVHITCTNEQGVVYGIVPAPQSRIVARIADPQKIQTVHSPKSEDYTGTDFDERFYVPSEAGDVMYLSLGLIDGERLRSLFDRPSNIAIAFSPDGQLRRNASNPLVMDLTAPAKGGTALISLLFNYFTEVLGNPRYVPYDDSRHATAPTGWNSWLAFFDQSTEQDIVEAADWVAANLKPYGMVHLQQDDGYSKPEARHWVKEWDAEKYPHGPEWLANYIRSKGLIPGFWSQPYSLCITGTKPEWFLRGGQGKVAMDYLGGGELDFTRPDVIQDYWRPILTEMKRQGWEYLKFDMGSTVETWKDYRNNFYDKSQTPYDISHKTLTIFREILGPDMWFTDHPDVSGARIGLVDVVGCGQDPGPGWRQLNHFLRAISNNTYQNHIIWYSDPDCIVLRGKPTRADAKQGNTEFATFEEARTAASLLSITGLQLLSGDDLLNLEPDRVDLIKKIIPIMPIFPVDLFGRSRAYSRYPKIFDLKVNMPSGIYDVVAVTNWGEAPSERTVAFGNDLGLNTARSYVVFDFWEQKLLGTYQDDFTIPIPSHGTRVFAVHPESDHPMLLGTNRHITGAFGIERQGWKPEQRILEGLTQTVPNAEYQLFIYVPEDMQVKRVTVDGRANVYSIEAKQLLTVGFLGLDHPAEWSIEFGE
jgi:hypothetical protein